MRSPASNFSKLAFILGQLRAVGLGMPEMDHAGCKHAVLAADAGMQQAHDDIGIFLAPATIVGIKTVDAIKIGPPNGEVARARALPGSLLGAGAAGRAADAEAPTAD